MRLSNIKRIIVEDFPEEYKELVDKIAYCYNPLIDQLSSGLNKNINEDNLNREFPIVTVEVNALGVPKILTQIKTNLGRIKGFHVIYAQHATNSTTYPTGAPWISWTIEQNLITIKHISGLQADNKYKLTLEIIG